MGENIKGFRVPSKNRTYSDSESTAGHGKQANPPKSRVTGGSPNKFGPDQPKSYGSKGKK